MKREIIISKTMKEEIIKKIIKAIQKHRDLVNFAYQIDMSIVAKQLSFQGDYNAEITKKYNSIFEITGNGYLEGSFEENGLTIRIVQTD